MGLERRIGRLEAQAIPAEPVPEEDLPIEHWTEELLSNDSGPALYGREEDEWARFEDWLEMIGVYLSYHIGRRITEAGGERLGLDDPAPLSEKTIERAMSVADPYIESWRVRYEEAVSQREAKRQSYERWKRGAT